MRGVGAGSRPTIAIIHNAGRFVSSPNCSDCLVEGRRIDSPLRAGGTRAARARRRAGAGAIEEQVDDVARPAFQLRRVIGLPRNGAGPGSNSLQFVTSAAG
jgi:hypothetical protein